MSINGTQRVGAEKGAIEFQNYFIQIPVPFKIYADFECNLESTEVWKKVLTLKNIMPMFLVVLLRKLFLLMIDLINRVLFIDVKL